MNTNTEFERYVINKKSGVDGVSGPSRGLEENDRISFGGAEGTVLMVDPFPSEAFNPYPAKIRMDDGHLIYATVDGRTLHSQTTPVITVTGKERVKTKVYLWVYCDWSDTDDYSWKVTDKFYSEDNFPTYTYGNDSQKIEASAVEVYL